MDEIKCCPFCGSNNIGYSIKTTDIDFKKRYRVQLYCKNCHAYGPRIITEKDKNFNWRGDIEKDESYKQEAIKKWNERK